MVAALATLVMLNAEPGYSLVVSRRVGVEAGRAIELTAELAQALEAEPSRPLGALVPVPEAAATLAKAGFPDSAVCNGAVACVASLAKVSGLTRLVALQLVKVGAELTVDASVVDGASGRAVAVLTRTMKLRDVSEGLRAFSAELTALASEIPPAEVVAPDAPTAVTLTPEPRPPGVTLASGLPTGRKVALGLGAGAVAALVVGIVLGVVALGLANALSAFDPRYEAHAAAARRTGVGADVVYGTAGALAIGAVLTWFLAPPSP